MASLEVGSIQATLGANVSQFVTGMRQAQNSFQGVVSGVSKGSVAIQQSSKQATNSLQAMASGVMGLQRTVQRSMAAIGAYTIIPSIFAKAKSAIIDFNQQLDQSRIAMTHFAGSKEAAEDLLDTLQEFAARTPFNFQDLLGTTQQMMAMGVQADQLLPRLTAIGDAAAALGGSPEVMQRIQRALGQIQAKGRVQAEELMQLAEVGIPAYQYMADIVGGSIPDALAKMKKGEIDSATAVSALLDGLSRDFKGMMESQSKTMMGALSTVQDYVQMTVGALGRPIFEALRGTMLKIADFLQSPEMQAGAERLASSFADALRQVGDVLGQVLRVIGPAFKEAISIAYEFGKALVSGIDQAKPVFLVVAGAVMVVVKSLQGMLEILSPLVKMIGGNKTASMALAVALGLVVAKSKLLGTSMKVVNGQAVMQSRSLQRMVDSIKANVSGFREYITTMRRFSAMNGTSLTTFGALRTATVAGFQAMGAAAKSFLASLGPMLAMALAITAVTKVIGAIANRNKDLKERTKELTSAIKENTTALLENEEALKGGAKGADILSDAIFKTGENGEKLVAAFGKIGMKADLAQFARAEDDFVGFAQSVLMSKGATEEEAKAIAKLVDAVDKHGSSAKIENQFRVQEYNPALLETAKALEEIQDQTENTDFAKLVQAQVDSMLGSGQVTTSMIAQAQAMTDLQVESEGLSEAAEQVAFQQNLMAIVTDAARKKMTISEQTAGEFQARLDALQRQEIASAMAGKTAAEAYDVMALSAKEGKVELDDFIASQMGGVKSTAEFERMLRSAKNSAEKMFDEIAFGKKSMDDLRLSGFDLREQLLQMVFTAKELGQGQEEVTRQQQNMAQGFVSAAVQAGYTDEEIQTLIKSLGILDGLDPTIKIYTDTADAEADILKFLNAAQALGDAGFISPGLNKQIENARNAIESLTNPRKKTGGGGGGGSKGGPFDWVKTWIEDLANYTENLLSKDFRQRLFESTPEQIGEIIADVVEEGMRLGVFLFDKDNALAGLFLDVNKALQDNAKEIQKIQQKYADAQSEVTSLENAIASLEAELDDFRRIEKGELLPTEKLEQGKSLLEELRGALESLKAAYQEFTSPTINPLDEQISKLNALQGVIDTLKNSYDSFESSVTDTRTPLEKEIDTLSELRSQYEELVSARDDYKKQVTESTGKMEFAARGGVLGQAKRFLAKAQAFRDVIVGLRDRNFPPALIQEVISAGTDAGTALGRKLLSLSDADLSELLDVQKQIAEVSAQAGEVAADVLFTADVNDAEAAFSRQTSIVRQMYQTALAQANADFQAQRQIVDQMYQDQIAQAQNAFDQQKKVVEALYKSAIADAEKQLRKAKDISEDLQGSLDNLAGVMNDLIQQIYDAIKAAQSGSSSGGGSSGGGWTGNVNPDGSSDWTNPGTGETVHFPPNWNASATHRAMGGPVSAKDMYVVGERGPELFVPRANGTIIPNGSFGGASTYNITVNTSGHGADVGREVVKAIQQYERRNGKAWRK